MQADKETAPKRTRAYVEEVFSQIEKKPDICDIIILNQTGNPVKTTMEYQTAIQFAGLYGILQAKTELGLQKINKDDQLLMLSVHTKFNEILITPDDKITVMVIQNAVDQYQM